MLTSAAVTAHCPFGVEPRTQSYASMHGLEGMQSSYMFVLTAACS